MLCSCHCGVYTPLPLTEKGLHVQDHLGSVVVQSEKDFFPTLVTLSGLRHLELDLGYHASVTPGRFRPPTPPSELTALTHVALRAPIVPKVTANFICGVLESASLLETLELHTSELTNEIASQFAQSISHITGLKSISINGWDVMTSEGSKAVSEAIEGLTKLTKLDLSGAFSEDLGYKHLNSIALPRLRNLKKLVLEGCELRDASVHDISNALSTLTGIEDLQVCLFDLSMN